MRPVKGPMIMRPKGTGAAFPVNPETDIAKEAETNLATVARDEYDGPDPRFIGKTRLEAAVLSLAVDATLTETARTEFLDRIMGRPKQRNENLNVTFTLHEFLSQLAGEDTIDAEVLDAADYLS